MLHCHLLAIKINKGAVSLKNPFDETVRDNFFILLFCVMTWETYYKHFYYILKD